MACSQVSTSWMGWRAVRWCWCCWYLCEYLLKGLETWIYIAIGPVEKFTACSQVNTSWTGWRAGADAGAADIRPAGRSSEWKCQWMDCCFMRRRWLLYSLGPYQRKVCLIWPSCQKKRRRAGLQTAQRSPAPGWQTLTAASNNQTTPHTNLHFSFFQTLVHALFLFI